LVKAGILLRRARALAADEPTGFVWVYEGRLAGSGYPASKRQVTWLGRNGIDSILSVTEDPLPSSWVRKPMSYMHIPMQDHEPPEQGSLASAAARIDSELASGRVILVHCQAGRGRTMCAIGAYLIKSRGMGAQEALDFLRGIRPNAVEQRQEASLREFAAAASRSGSGNDLQ
jgi:atypical dual specificity phosphatase